MCDDYNVVSGRMESADWAEDQERRNIAKEAARAITFFDKTRAASEEEQAAVGRDHWDWIESVVRKLAATKECI